MNLQGSLNLTLIVSTSHLQHGLPVGVELHDGLGPLHHGFSSGDFDSLVFEPTHPELSGVVPTHRGGRPRALHGRLAPVLEPHDRPADTPGSEVTVSYQSCVSGQ